MKKVILLFVAVVLSQGITAQIETPQSSPFQKIEQTVGLTDVTLEYSRPSKKGRTIFGGLVPYNAIWRTGANANTKITFSEDVEVGGKTLKAGSYAIYTKPGVSSWDVYFYSDANNWGTPETWDNSKVAAQVSAQAYPMGMDVETFTMSFDNLKHDEANLGMIWEKVYVGVPIKFNTDKKVTANINKVMSGPSANDYYAAAIYYLQADKDINQARAWIDKSFEMMDTPRFWQLRQKALIYAKAGDKKGAIEAAKKSLKMAKEAGNTDYVALNEKSLKEWGAM
ncbi:MAG: dihydrolipoamide dehydrogenase [Aequorivita sp.]|nr:dihydrolipoamide dehydrogenase [Aequorivita sp.]|tara:strand:- start:22816 stop:23661 length:846 start_codon:yes stop_codon:yes gene_type:complete